MNISRDIKQNRKITKGTPPDLFLYSDFVRTLANDFNFTYGRTNDKKCKFQFSYGWGANEVFKNATIRILKFIDLQN